MHNGTTPPGGSNYKRPARRHIKFSPPKRPALLPTPATRLRINEQDRPCQSPQQPAPKVVCSAPFVPRNRTIITAAYFIAEERKLNDLDQEITTLAKVCIHCIRAVAAEEEKIVKNWELYAPVFQQFVIDLSSIKQTAEYECRICTRKLYFQSVKWTDPSTRTSSSSSSDDDS